MSSPDSETTALLQGSNGINHSKPDVKVRASVWGALTSVFIVGVVFVLWFPDLLSEAFSPILGTLPKDPMLAALSILDHAPVIVRVFQNPSPSECGDAT